MATRTRRDVWQVPEWDDVLIWYARAVREMQTRPLSDPTSWRYQAAIHEFNGDADPSEIPADAQRFWDQCQHGTWFFLPWHRWYLYYFEQIVAKTVVDLGGPADWSLPYWNYSDPSNPDALSLSPELWAETMPDGSPNALRVERRTRGNDGSPVGTARHADLSCLSETQFEEEAAGGSPGFGGPITTFMHGGDVNGVCENVPHGTMHVRVGGYMGAFDTAGLDPLFWLHHANIDRLWVVWRRRHANNIDPTKSSWLNMSFDFHDANGAVVTRTVADAVDTANLGYEYEDVSDPLGGGLESAEPPRRRVSVRKPIAEMIGATDKPIALTSKPATTRVKVNPPAGPGLESAEGGEPQRMFVNVENVTGLGEPRTYSVYVNDVFAGVLPMFGVPESTRATEKHGGGGKEYRIEITNILPELKQDDKWDPKHLRVTFVPDDEDEGLEAAGDVPQFEVGRVSVTIA